MMSIHRHPSHRGLCVLLLLAMAAVPVTEALAAATATSAAPAPATDAPATVGAPTRITLWSTIAAGGIIGFLIVLMSLVAVALVVEHITIRRDRLVPATLAQELEGLLGRDAHEQAQQACARDGSFLGQVVGAGLNQIGAMFGFFDMQNAMQEVSERQISKLYRKLEYLSFIAATAPMMGLLGTVTGMIRAFNKIAATEGVDGIFCTRRATSSV